MIYFLTVEKPTHVVSVLTVDATAIFVRVARYHYEYVTHTLMVMLAYRAATFSSQQ